MTYESQQVFTFDKDGMTLTDAREWMELFLEDAKRQLEISEKVNYAIAGGNTKISITVDTSTESGKHMVKLLDELLIRAQVHGERR